MKIIRIAIKLIRKIRQAYWTAKFKACGENFLCRSGVKIKKAKNITIGNNVCIGEKSFIHGKGGVTIGNNVKIGPELFLYTWNHNYYAPEKLPYDKTIIEAPVIIEDNVWIGAKVCIVPGVTIKEGAVISMGSVVTKDVPACAVVGGNPAQVIKYRDIDVYNDLKEKKMYNLN